MTEILPAFDPDDPWGGANPDDPDFKHELHARYHVLRERHPVHQTPRGVWRLTRYDDCVELLRRTSAGVRTTEGKLPFADESERPRAFMLDQDPPNHTRLRKLVAHAFKPSALALLQDKIDSTTDALLDAVADRGEMDVVADLALPLPATMICEMLGVPIGDQDMFVEWTTDATYFILGLFASPEQRERCDTAMSALTSYIEDLLAECRANPRDDLLTLMAQAEEEGDRLSNEELIFQSIGLLIAGFETTTGLIANGTRQFLLHPDQLGRLRAEPELLDSAVEECLRYDGPIVAASRLVHQDTVFGGHTIKKNSPVLAVVTAANRDPAQFPDPDRFDIARSPNKHLAFGGGIHHCLGAHLARLEARSAFSRLFSRFPNLALKSSELTWGKSLFRIPAELPVTL